MAREDPQLKLRLTEEMKARVTEAAKANNRSVNAEIVERLDRSFYQAVERDLLSMLADGVFPAALPPGLAARIQSAAESRRQTVDEEIIQALLEAYPPPASFSIDTFIAEWVDRIMDAADRERPFLVERANEVLVDNGDKYELWIEEGRVVFGSKGAKELPQKRRQR